MFDFLGEGEKLRITLGLFGTLYDYNAQLGKVSAITTTIKSLPSGFTLRKIQLSDYSSKAS